MSSNVATVQAIYAAFGRGDIPGILEHLGDTVSWEHDWGGPTLPLFTPRLGRDQVPEFFAALQAIRISRFEPVNLLSGGDQVVAVIRLEATVVATGQQISDLEAHLWTFGAYGRITAFRHLADTWQYARAMGLAS